MKKFVTVIFSAFLLIGLLAGCGKSDEATDNGSEEKVITMGTSADYPPFETHDETNGEIIGFDVEIAKYIANELGYTLKIKDMSFNGLIGALQADRVDFVASAMSATEDRKKSVDFSTEYHHSGEMFVTLKDSNMKSMDDIAGKKIGVQLGTIQEEGLKKAAAQYEGMEIKTLDKAPDLIQELKSNRIYAVYLDKTVALEYIDKLDLLGFDDTSGNTPGMAIAFPKGHDELVADFNKVLAEMKENGELEKLAKEWLDQK